MKENLDQKISYSGLIKYELLEFGLFDSIKNNIFQTLITPDKYLITKNYLGYSPKIISYDNGKLEIEIEGLYNEKQFHFLINFF